MELKKILFVLIIILFLVTRLYKIDEIPASVYWDEASIAYNAYSVSQGGRDEWGDFLPLHFRAFGEFKLPVYIYTVSIFQMILGFNEWSLRLPAVIFSLGTVMAVYLLGRNLFHSDKIGLMSAFILTIFPGFFIFSRTGYEATSGLFFFILGIHIFIKSLKGPKFLLLSVISFALSLYSYNAFRILIPLVLPFLILLYLKERNKIKDFKLPLLFIGSIVFSYIPILRFMLSPEGGTRLERVSIFATQGVVNATVQLIRNYLDHFSLSFLFIKGDLNLRSHTQGLGELYWFWLPFLILGTLALFWKNKGAPRWIIFITLLTPIPAAITKESPHALRSVALFPLLSLITAYGALEVARSIKYKFISIFIFVVISLGCFGFYFNYFLSTYKISSSLEWQYPYKNLFLSFADRFKDYDRIIISDEYGQPYIFALYYLRYPPEKFREEVRYNSPSHWGVSTVAQFNKFEFRNVDINSLPKGRYLAFVDSKHKLDGREEIETMRDLEGRVAFYVYDVEKD